MYVYMYQCTSLSLLQTHFMSTATTTPPTPTTTKLLVVGGDAGNTGPIRYLADVELIDPLIQSSECTDPPDYPFPVLNAAATMIHSKDAIVCGGYNKDTGKRNIHLNVFRTLCVII